MKQFEFAYDIRQWLLANQGRLSLPVCVEFASRKWTVDGINSLYVIQDVVSGARGVL